MFIRAVFVILLFGSCKPIEVLEPHVDYKPTHNTKKIVVSSLNFPVEIDLTKALDVALSSIPSVIYGENDVCEGLSFKYDFSKRDLNFNLNTHEILFSIFGDFGLYVNYCPKCVSFFGNTSCVVPRVYASCGQNGEKKRRIKIDLSVVIDIDSDYHLNTKASVKSVRFLDPCEFSFLKLDFTSEVADNVRNNLQNTCNEIEKTLYNFDIKSYVDNAWINMQNNVDLGGGGFLYLNPSSIGLSSYCLKNNKAYLNLSISIGPQIIPVQHTLKQKKLPSLIKTSDTSSVFKVYSDAFFSFQQLSLLLNQNFKHKKVNIKNKILIVDSIGVMYYEPDKLMFKVRFSGTKRGVLFLTGKPTFSEDYTLFFFDDVDFSLKTKSVLLKAADWLLSKRLLSFIVKNATVSLDDFFNEEIKKYNSLFKEFNFDDITIINSISDLKLNNHYIHETGIDFRFLVSGKMKLKL